VRDRPRGREAGLTVAGRDDRTLVTIELRFVTGEDPEQLADRIKESISMIVGREHLEDFRVRLMPLAPPKKPHAV
jgi:hypothetical protein